MLRRGPAPLNFSRYSSGPANYRTYRSGGEVAVCLWARLRFNCIVGHTCSCVPASLLKLNLQPLRIAWMNALEV